MSAKASGNRKESLAIKANNKKQSVKTNANHNSISRTEWWNDKLVHQQVMLKEGSKWYSSLPIFDGGIEQSKVSKDILSTIMSTVPKAFDAEVIRYKDMKSKQKDNDQKWIADTIKSGTLSGKLLFVIIVLPFSYLVYR